MMRNFMHQFIALITLCFVFTANVNAENEEPAIRSVMLAYEQAWSEHDAKAVASYYFAPAIRVSKTGPSVRATIKDQELFFEGLLGSMVARGYDHSEWETLNIHQMDERTATASGITLRYKKDGSLMERTAVSYGLWKDVDSWKIFWSATHNPSSVMAFK